MASPYLYWYPDPAGSAELLNFSESLQDRHRKCRATVRDSYDGAGRGYRAHVQTSHRVRILLERFGSAGANSLERKFATLESHLYKGGLVGFSQDHAKSWASVTATAPQRGDTLLTTTTGNGFSAWNATATPVTGDEIVVETAHPESQHAIGIADTISGVATTINLTSGSVYTYGGPAIVRWRYFYPVCWLPEDQVGKPIVTSDHDRTYTLDLELEYMPQLVLDLYQGANSFGETGTGYPILTASGQVSPGLRNDTAGQGFGGWSLEEALGGTRRVRGSRGTHSAWGS